MKSLFSTILFFALASLGAPAAWSGGEIGNHRYISYEDKLLELETIYPGVWKRVNVGPSVSFIENGQSAQEASIVNINAQNFESVRSIGDLEGYLRKIDPSADWQPTILAGKEGFQSRTEGGQGLIYLLRAEDNVMSIRYKQRDEQQAKVDVGTILTSLQLK